MGRIWRREVRALELLDMVTFFCCPLFTASLHALNSFPTITKILFVDRRTTGNKTGQTR